MSKPLFASKWYKDAPASELRQEIQNLYRIIGQLTGEIETTEADLGADIDALENDKVDRAGDTMTGNLGVQGLIQIQDDAEAKLHLRVGTEDVTGLYGMSNGNAVLTSEKSGGNIYIRPNGRDSSTREIVWGAASDAPLFRDASNVQQPMWHGGNAPLTTGTWTPTLSATDSAPSVTYAARVGVYARLGPRLVWVFLRVGTTSRSGGSGSIRITGFPFSMNSISNGTAGVLAVESSQIDYGTGVRTLTGRARATDTSFSLITNPSDAGHAFVTIDKWNSTGVVAMSGIVLIEPNQ